MKLDYLIRMKKQYEGRYMSHFPHFPHLKPKDLVLGKRKLSKEGRKTFEDILSVKVEVDTKNKQIGFDATSLEECQRINQFLLLMSGQGSISEFNRYIEED